MKKIFLSTFVLLTFCFANAQDKKDMSFGVKAGLNLATITNADGSKTLVGFLGGVFGEFMLSDKFALQPEVMYSGQGTKFDAGDFNLDYINIPVMAKYYVAEAFSLELGPQIGFLVSAKNDGVDVKDTLKTTDVSLDFGASYNITSNFILGVRYDLGLTRLQKDKLPGQSDSKNSVFQIAVGYRF